MPETPMADDDLPFPEATASDPDAENDASLLDLDTFCAFCGLRHLEGGNQRDCNCPRHIDGGTWLPCNAARPHGGE